MKYMISLALVIAFGAFIGACVEADSRAQRIEKHLALEAEYEAAGQRVLDAADGVIAHMDRNIAKMDSIIKLLEEVKEAK